MFLAAPWSFGIHDLLLLNSSISVAVPICVGPVSGVEDHVLGEGEGGRYRAEALAAWVQVPRSDWGRSN